jgi:hypothetical protein
MMKNRSVHTLRTKCYSDSTSDSRSLHSGRGMCYTSSEIRSTAEPPASHEHTPPVLSSHTAWIHDIQRFLEILLRLSGKC